MARAGPRRPAQEEYLTFLRTAIAIEKKIRQEHPKKFYLNSYHLAIGELDRCTAALTTSAISQL